MRWFGRISLATAVFFAALVVFWTTAPMPLRQSIALAATPVACFPNPNASGPPNMVNGCPLPASIFNFFLNGNYKFFVVTAYGAKGDGSTNDTGAFNSAYAACSANGGGFIFVPPTGNAYALVTAPNSLPSGCMLTGMGEQRWPTGFPYDNTESDWTASGSWLNCQDTVNACIHITGTGSSVGLLNFWYNQPTPPNGTSCGSPCTFTHGWTPTNYPFTILVDTTSNSTRLSRISILNATNCIDFEGPNNGVAGIWTSEEHLALGCANTGQKFHMIDNVISINDVHHEMWWYQGSSDWWGYLEGPNHVDWDVCYLANPMINNVEFAFSGLAMKLTDCSVSSGFGAITFAMETAQMSNVSFNEVCQAMTVANSTTHVIFNAVNTIAYSDSTTSQVAGQCANQSGATSPANFLFQLNSDNVIASFNGLAVGFVQGLATIGGGGVSLHGQLHINQLLVQAYSAYQANTPAILTDATGSTATVVDGPTDIFASGSFTAGPRCSGNGCTTGAFSVQGAAEIDGSPGTSRQLYLSSSATPPLAGSISCPRWSIRADATAESGSDAGSNLDFDAYHDNCSYRASPMVINRATGMINLNAPFLLEQVTVATLPSCGAPQLGEMVLVTDLNAAPTYRQLSPFTGSGTFRSPLMCNGSAWEAH